MYAGIAPQQDFFLYVPLLREEEVDPPMEQALHKSTERVVEEGDSTLELSTWTKIILPTVTIYTHHCGEEREFQWIPRAVHWW